jgi:hypothetical protein
MRAVAQRCRARERSLPDRIQYGEAGAMWRYTVLHNAA